MTHRITNHVTINSHWSRLYKIGGATAFVAGILLLVGMISLIASILRSETASGWLSLIQNNWLVKMFILHSGLSDIHADLRGLNLLDIFILLLVSVICLSISTIFRNARKVLSQIAFAFSVIAIILFLATLNAGRSTVMLAVLINSFVMFRDKAFGKVTIYTGILASVFLFVGDLTVGVHSNIITTLFSIGYVLLIIWFFLIAQSLFRLSHVS